MAHPRVVAIIQARVGSSRLAGKILLCLGKSTMLESVVSRVKSCPVVDEVVVAIPDTKCDDPLYLFSIDHGWEVFRGSERDVLDRYYQAALQYKADIIVRVTSDCPFIDPGVMQDVITPIIEEFPSLDYCSNVVEPRTFPRGLDCEAFTIQALERSHRLEKELRIREHVTQTMLRNPSMFTLKGISSGSDCSNHRWTVDTVDDYHLCFTIGYHFAGKDYSWKDILEYLDSDPDLLSINEHVQQKSVE